MKKIYKSFSVLMLALTSATSWAQCGSPTLLGSATNMFTLIRNGNNPVAVDKSMNMVVFIHRTNAALMGGNSGELRYDFSTNAGSTWTLNQGILNPQNANYARYPNMAIYNPTNNTTPTNAYVSYLAPTIHSTTSAWNGVVSGVRQLNNTGTTETYNQNSMGTNQIPHSLVNGAPGVFWAIDPIISTTYSYNIYKGVWSTSLNDVVWSINTVISPPWNTGWSTFATVGDYNIAFDPTGVTGYVSVLGHVSPGPLAYALYPVLYKTTNGGNTWTGPIQVDLGVMGCITSNVSGGNVASANPEHDLVVDANGTPHIITTVGSAANYAFNYNNWHHMYDITMKNGLWTAYDLGNVNGAPYTSGISPNFAVQMQAPQAARSANGQKVFFTWTDNSNYTLGQQNTAPDLYGKAFDVSTGNWTQTKNFSACNTNAMGKIIFPHLAPEVLEPSLNNWKLAPVYGEIVFPNDLGQTANFIFLDNVTFSSSEFTVTTPPATVTIAQAPTLLYCPGSTININVPNGGDVLWSTGATTNTLPITTGSISTYSVIAQVGCLIGTASISVTEMTVNAGAVTPSICPGQQASFTVTGNAFSYSWTPAATGTNVTMSVPFGSVTVMAFGSNNCAVTNTISVTVMPKPTITIVGNNTICAGTPSVVLTASGAATYIWSDNSTGLTYTSVATNTVSVIGTGANSCTNTASIIIKVNPNPTVNVVSTHTAVCIGETFTLTGSGATSYSWNGVAGTGNMTVNPSATATYSLTGANNFSCQSAASTSVIVNPLPQLTVTASRPSVCKGEKVILTASGADSYTWTPGALITKTLQVNAINAQTYNYQIAISNTTGCTNSGTFALVVSACNGIDQIESTLPGLLVYPNPNNGSFVVKTETDLQVTLTNELGQLIMDFQLNGVNNHTTEIQDLKPGIYFIGLKDQSVRKQKIVVSR